MSDLEHRLIRLESQVNSLASKSDIRDLSALRVRISGNFYIWVDRGLVTFLSFLLIMLSSVAITSFFAYLDWISNFIS